MAQQRLFKTTNAAGDPSYFMLTPGGGYKRVPDHDVRVERHGGTVKYFHQPCRCPDEVEKRLAELEIAEDSSDLVHTPTGSYYISKLDPADLDKMFGSNTSQQEKSDVPEASF